MATPIGQRMFPGRVGERGHPLPIRGRGTAKNFGGSAQPLA